MNGKASQDSNLNAKNLTTLVQNAINEMNYFRDWLPTLDTFRTFAA